MAISIALLAGCTQDYDTFVLPENQPPQLVTPPPAPMNVAGTWFSRAENNAVNCGMGQYVDGKSIHISQDVGDISLLTSTGEIFAGTLRGDIVEWTGSFPERNGSTDYTSAALVFSADSGAGDATWTWSDGVDSCNGTMALSFGREATPESAANSRPEIADQFEFTDNVAFFTGTLGEGLDATDYFSFTATADGMLQVELSHFDLASTNLDLQILDEALNPITVSASPDGFEIADAPILTGQRYYIRIDATSTAGPDTYNLSVDFN